MLALLATQAAVPSVRVVAAFEVAWLTRTGEQQQAPRTLRKPRRIQRTAPLPQPPAYLSPASPEPDRVLLYQLPPPDSSFAS